MTDTSTMKRPLELRQVRKSFDDVVAVDGIDLQLEPGEVHALVGPSGCGKSTLLRTIAGLLSIDSGEIALAGELVDNGKVRRPPEARSAGLVFQEHALFPHLTVADNLAFGLRDGTPADRARRIDEMLDLVSLAGYGKRFPHELSGGERQRVALARALAPDPAIMLFDEPFASLDPNLRTQLRHDVIAVLKATKTAAVFVTHDQREALSLGDRISVMKHGRIIQLGTPERIFHHPVSQFVGAFMGPASFLDIEISAEGTPQTALGPIELEGHTPEQACAMVRPDDVRFESNVAGDAEITLTDYTGTHWLVSARLDSGSELKFLTSHLESLQVGDRGTLQLLAGHPQVLVTTNAPHGDAN